MYKGREGGGGGGGYIIIARITAPQGALHDNLERKG